MQRPQKTPRDAYDTPKDTQRCLETFDSSKDTQQCSERLFQRHLGMPGEFGILQRYLEMPGATQGAKNTLRDVKLPRATWVSPGFSRSKPLFPDDVIRHANPISNWALQLEEAGVPYDLIDSAMVLMIAANA